MAAAIIKVIHLLRYVYYFKHQVYFENTSLKKMQKRRPSKGCQEWINSFLTTFRWSSFLHFLRTIFQGLWMYMEHFFDSLKVLQGQKMPSLVLQSVVNSKFIISALNWGRGELNQWGGGINRKDPKIHAMFITRRPLSTGYFPPCSPSTTEP